MKTDNLSICLWFDSQAEEAVKFYVSVFNDASIGNITRYGKEGFEFHKKPVGTAMTVEFKINGMQFLALNGGPQFKFNESISIVVNCDTQEEIDSYWEKLTYKGEEGPCGWLKDMFGVSWQIVPSVLQKYLVGDAVRAQRVTAAFLKMQKFNIAELEKAYNGE